MIKAYKLKIYANSSKLNHIDGLITRWSSLVNGFIEFFWEQNAFPGRFPPKELIGRGDTLIGNSSILAWNLVKACKKNKRPYPSYGAEELPLSNGIFKFTLYKSKEFDFWLCITSGHGKGSRRLRVPCKKTKILNQALSKGELKVNSCKILKVNSNWYLMVYVEFPDETKENTNKLGVDVGHYNAIATSDGRILGQDLWPLRIRTKHRKYKGKTTPSKQRLNFYAKRLHTMYPETDFIMEKLTFDNKRPFGHEEYKSLRIKWAYMQLTNRLAELGQMEGFQVCLVNPFNTSRKCLKCGYASKENRKRDDFTCLKCGFHEHADVVGAINILTKEYPVSSEHVKLLIKSS
jgi:transposase